jgi:hypothetical protein
MFSPILFWNVKLYSFRKSVQIHSHVGRETIRRMPGVDPMGPAGVIGRKGPQLLHGPHFSLKKTGHFGWRRPIKGMKTVSSFSPASLCQTTPFLCPPEAGSPVYPAIAQGDPSNFSSAVTEW